MNANGTSILIAVDYHIDDSRGFFSASFLSSEPRSATADHGRLNDADCSEAEPTAFETAIMERYRRRESSVEEALIEMYLAGVSVRRVEDITQALWGTRISARLFVSLQKRRRQQWVNIPLSLDIHWGHARGNCP
jgi:hypothetical protein